MTTETEQHDEPKHDAFQNLRRAGEYWKRFGEEQLEGADLLEGFLPDFIRRRYIVDHFYRSSDRAKAHGSVKLMPVDGGTEDPKVANVLHADVNKLFRWLLNKRGDVAIDAPPHQEPVKPKRSVNSIGSIRYEFTINDLGEFPDGLAIEFSGLGAGSACRITRKVTGTHVEEDVTYEMVCDDDPKPGPESIPAEDTKEAARP